MGERKESRKGVGSRLNRLPTPFLDLLNLVEGASSGVVAAAFTDADGNTGPSAYTATVDWGDGAGAQQAYVGGNGTFTVGYNHVYAEEGSYNVIVSVTDADGAAATLQETATVADAPLSASSDQPQITATTGQLYNSYVAAFNDADPGATAGDFTASIDWGDGSAASAGWVNGPGPSFWVGGQHTYAASGDYVVTTTVQDAGGAVTVLNVTAVVSDPPAVSVAAVGPDANESTGQSGAFRFSRTGDLSNSLTVNYTVSGTGAADSGVEYQALPGSVTIAAGQAYADVAVQPIPDDDSAGSPPPPSDASSGSGLDPTGLSLVTPIDDSVNGDETVTVTLSGTSSGSSPPYVIGPASSDSVTLHEDPSDGGGTGVAPAASPPAGAVAFADPAAPPAPAAPMAGQVTSTPYTIGQKYAQIKAAQAKDPKYTSDWPQFVKDSLGVDLSNPKNLEAREKFAGLYNVRDSGPFVIADFLGMTRFAVDLNGADASIIQTANVTITTDNGQAGTTTKKATIVEGWVVGADGKAAAEDDHLVSNKILTVNRALGVSVTFTADFEVGAGTYDGGKITGSRGDKGPSEPGAYDVFSNGDPTKVTWAGDPTKNLKYTVTYKLNNDGTWTYSDPSAGYSFSGKYNVVDKK